ncbi:MAG: dTMP kinase [Tatlockia sp.]|jgi:dTMP kinase
MSSRGQFIVVEGLEGAGKSTAIQTIHDFLKPLVPEILITREPGGTQIGETLRQIIKEKQGDEIVEPRAELLLLYAARVQLVEQVIRKALARGCWVLADRFELSTYAYQGGGRGLDLAFIARLSSFCLQGFKPDLTVFLDLSPEQGLERVKTRGAADRIEQESLDFFNRVHAVYQKMTQNTNSVVTIDASQPLDTVQNAIIHQLSDYMEHNG